MTRLPKPNVDLLDRTMAEVEKAARRKLRAWDQGIWRGPFFPDDASRCGTAMCFGGWALELDGAQWAAEPSEAFGDHVIARRGERAALASWSRFHSVKPPHKGRLVRAQIAARRRLGLTEQEANVLFDSSNTLADLRRLVAEIKARA